MRRPCGIITPMDRYNALKKATIAALLLSILTLGITLRVINLDNVAARSPDEEIYTYQARVISIGGIEGIRSLIKEHCQNKALWIYPPPTRIGYTGLYSMVMRLTNRTDEKVGSYISCVFSIISLVLLIVLSLSSFAIYLRNRMRARFQSRTM